MSLLSSPILPLLGLLLLCGLVPVVAALAQEAARGNSRPAPVMPRVVQPGRRRLVLPPRARSRPACLEGIL